MCNAISVSPPTDNMYWYFTTNIARSSTAITSKSNWTCTNAYSPSTCGTLRKFILRLITMCAICMPSPVLSVSTDWFYLNSVDGTPVRCTATPDGLECASTGSGCQWGTYGQSWLPFENITPNVTQATSAFQTSCPGWASETGLDPCEVLGCYSGRHWYYSDASDGVPVRCASTPNHIECASDDGGNCKWSFYGQSWSFGQKMSGVSGTDPIVAVCPGWPSSLDSCEELGCYSVSPTTYPSNIPTVPTQPPTSAPSHSPSKNPSTYPTVSPSSATTDPSKSPSFNPTESPTSDPSESPSNNPSASPTDDPS
eukprot:220595_1